MVEDRAARLRTTSVMTPDFVVPNISTLKPGVEPPIRPQEQTLIIQTGSDTVPKQPILQPSETQKQASMNISIPVTFIVI